MSQAKKTHPTYLFVFIIGLLLLFSQAACSPNQQAAASNMLSNISNGVDAALVEADDLVFAGQIEDENGRWLNDCVVVLFKDGEEVVRTTSRLMESAFSNNGPMDGVFELRVPNTYKLSLAHEFYLPNQALASMSTVSGVVGTRYLGTWFEDLNPSDLRTLNVPDKQLEYALVVLSMPQNELPDDYKPGNLTFQNGMLVINQAGAIGGGDEAVTETAECDAAQRLVVAACGPAELTEAVRNAVGNIRKEGCRVALCFSGTDSRW